MHDFEQYIESNTEMTHTSDGIMITGQHELENYIPRPCTHCISTGLWLPGLAIYMYIVIYSPYILHGDDLGNESSQKCNTRGTH